MEISFEKLARRGRPRKIVVVEPKHKHSKKSSVSGGKKPRQNMALKKDIQAVLRHHKVKNMRHHMKHMAGSGIFDSIVGAVNKGVEFYNKNKDTIHKAVDLGVKHAPKALDLLKKIKGGKRTAGRRVGRPRLSEVVLGGIRSGGIRSGGKRKLPEALGQWIKDVKEYQGKHGCSYKEAMKALKAERAKSKTKKY